ncbi:MULTISPECIES: crosslink repair DNA glycosylase YcaQ family protein [Arthrobacter]|uniref:Crosslink repair DNA glycosylase YcaQ family protein n=2 Tax=Arthrobacter TaxID=1663 RepID=A0ABU9KJR1_9MICC|nr:crosslink repair DNA glycosylase YcaQ family protein [Arthrobacter sp. YJM1]MDP5226614.1 crosslink repair DNA glycosylase YcaQ family protein [Arthrobacter sp. YJM1]
MTSDVPSPDDLTPELLAAWSWHCQGLDGSAEGLAAEDVYSRYGWARSVGGGNPYLTLFSRAGLGREAADRALAELRIHELPSARGCAYVLGRDHFAFVLQAGRESGQAEVRVLEKLGVDPAEVDALAEDVVTVLDGCDGPLDPAGLRDVLGDKVRSMGEEGRKKGVSTTLPTALGLLQRDGRIRRVPPSGRLDQQRFGYTTWDLPPSGLDDEQARAELLRLYLSWTGGAGIKEIQWFTGFTVAQSKKAIAAVGAVECTTAEGAQRWMLPSDVERLGSFRPGGTPQLRLLASSDALVLLRRNAAELIADPVVADDVLNGGSALSADLEDHIVVDRGQIIGLWHYDPDAGKIAAWLFPDLEEPQERAAREEIVRVGEWIAQDLGDFRSNSLDSPKGRRKRIDHLNGLAGLGA